MVSKIFVAVFVFSIVITFQACGPAFKSVDSKPSSASIEPNTAESSAQFAVTTSEQERTLFEGSSGTLEFEATGGTLECNVSVFGGTGSALELTTTSLRMQDGQKVSLQIKARENLELSQIETASVNVDCGANNQALTEVRIVPRRMATTVGTHHTCAIGEDHFLWCWGRATLGQLGYLSNKSQNVPFKHTSRKYELVRAGTHWSCAKSTANEVYCFGQNVDGNLGTGDFVGRTSIETKVKGLPQDVQIVDLGLARPFNMFVTQIKLGFTNDTPNHACALLANGEVWCWGNNKLGQLGQPASVITNPVATKVPNLGPAKSLGVGAGHNCASMKADDSVWCWGDNHAAQLGELAGTAETSHAPVKVSATLRAKKLIAGGAFNCVIDMNDTLKCWGRNTNFELGSGVNVAKSTVALAVTGMSNVRAAYAGDFHACAIKADATTWCWGDNYAGQIGDGTSSSTGGKNAAAPVRLMGLSATPVAMALGNFATLAILPGGATYFWGHQYFGEGGTAVLFGPNLHVPTRVVGFDF